MEEKKLTDKATLDSLKEMAIKFSKDIYVNRVLVNAIDFIHRLQAENEQQKAEIELLSKVISSSKRKTKILEMQREIERLTSMSNLQRDGTRLYERRCEELQKQVDELTEQRNKNYLKGEIIMKDEKTLLNEIKEQCGDCKAWSGTDCTRNPYMQDCLKDEKQVIECHGMLKGCDMVKQAVKDTAKEILQDLYMEFSPDYLFTNGYKNKKYADFIKEYAKTNYGVEVE